MEVVIDDQSLKEGETVVILILTVNEQEKKEIFRYTQPKRDRQWGLKIKRIELTRR